MMKIHPVFPVQSLTIRSKENIADKKSNGFNQVVELKSETPINLGTIGGKPFVMQIFQDGGYEWSGSLRIKQPKTGARVTPEEAAAAYASQSYNMEEHIKCGAVSAVINSLYIMTNKGLEPSTFNNKMRAFNISQSEVEEALCYLGININEAFTLNGHTFVLDNGLLKNTIGG